MTSTAFPPGDADASEVELDDATRADLYERLYLAVSSLSSAASTEEVLSATFLQAMELLDADAGFIGLVDEERDVLRVHRYGEGIEPGAVPLELPARANLPLATTAVDGRTRVIENNDQLECDFPDLQRLDATDHACASFPLVSGGRLRGAINIAFRTPRPISALELEVMRRIAIHCGEALERLESRD